MGEWHGSDPFWRSIEEPEDVVVVIRGLPATRPAAYDRWERRQRRETRTDRLVETLRRFAAFAFSALMHVLTVILVAELVYIAIPVVEATLVSAGIRKPVAKPDLPSPEPDARKEESPKTERPAEAPRVADEPAPPKTIAAPVVGSGASEPSARPVPVGVLESVQEIRETGLFHSSGDGVYEQRGEEGRKSAVGRYGGSEASEAAVELGLRWLAAHQSEDGRWSASGWSKRCPRGEVCGGRAGGAAAETFDHGVTGLALLAFLSAGYTHQTGGYRETVKAALEWLKQRQDPRGFFFDSSKGGHPQGAMYGHGVATFALGEAAAMTRDASLHEALKKAVEASVASQQYNGGWWYGASLDERSSEFTLSVWHMMGLMAAHKAGVEVPESVLDKAKQYIRESTDLKGGVYYSHRSNITLGSTGAGVFARCMLGMSEGDWIPKGLEYLSKHAEMEPDLGRMQSFQYVYAWYYRTIAAFQVQGRIWRDWNRRLRPYLVSAQRTRGHPAGSWPLIDYTQAGPVYSTAMCTLMLETYYRYLPMTSDRTALLDSLATAVEDAPGEAMAEVERRRLEEAQPPPPAEVLAKRREAERDLARQRVKSDKPEDRYLGARKLAELGDRESLKDLMSAAEKAPFERLRAAHIGYVGRLKCEESVPWLIQFLDDRDEDVRGVAMSALTNATGVYLVEADGWRAWYADWKRRKASGR
jgi:hypothetical protein